jgi:hypothetical protein
MRIVYPNNFYTIVNGTNVELIMGKENSMQTLTQISVNAGARVVTRGVEMVPRNVSEKFEIVDKSVSLSKES